MALLLRSSVVLSLLALAAGGCASVEGTQQEEAALVAPSFGTISGFLSYPAGLGDPVPALDIYAVSTRTGEHHHTTLAATTSEALAPRYELRVPPGEYQVFGYDTSKSTIRGAFTRATVCASAFEEPCTDHTPITVSVLKGERIDEVDVMDWSEEAKLPPEPKADVPVAGPSALLTGELSFPSEFVPMMSVYALRKGTNEFVRLDTWGAERFVPYAMRVEPGTYTVVAFPNTGVDLVGIHSKMVPCGLKAECDDHTLIEVTVGEHDVATGVDPADFFHSQDASFVRPDAAKR